MRLDKYDIAFIVCMLFLMFKSGCRGLSRRPEVSTL